MPPKQQNVPPPVHSTAAELPHHQNLRAHLVENGFTGSVATSPRSTIDNCKKLAEGLDAYTFGLSDWIQADTEDAIRATRYMCRNDPLSMDPSGPGWIDPDATMAAISHQRNTLAEFVTTGGGNVLLATGHPKGLLGHYIQIAQALADTGCTILRPLEDTIIPDTDGNKPRGIRYICGVACVFDGGGLRHSHSSAYMRAMLADLARSNLGTIDLVMGDHGMAGAAVEMGIDTLSIADVNDPALFLAQANQRTTGVMPIDDNLSPILLEPVTDAMIDWTASPHPMQGREHETS